MKKLKIYIFFIIIICLPDNSFSQEKSDEYNYKIYRADSLSQAGNYESALSVLHEAEKSEGKALGLVLQKAFIYGAKENKDSVIYNLTEAVEKFEFDYYELVNWVVDFRFLEEDPDFIALSNKIRNAFKTKVKADGKNEVVTLKLTDASIKDQIIRQEMDRPNLTSEEEKKLLKRGIQLDIDNQQLLVDILDKHGLPTSDWVDPRAAHTAFMIFLHADNNRTLQERGVNLYKKALEEEKIPPYYYENLKERMSL